MQGGGGGWGWVGGLGLVFRVDGVVVRGFKNDKRQHRVNIQNNTPLTGLEMWIRV